MTGLAVVVVPPHGSPRRERLCRFDVPKGSTFPALVPV
jgi:hypothetical protein